MARFHLFDATNSIDHELSAGTTVIGRSPECDIRLMSSSVSRKHAQFDVTDAGLTFSDLGSSNGSFVNGQQAKAALQLRDGDELALGDLRFSVRDDSADQEATQIASEAEQATQISSPAGDTGGDSDSGDPADEEIPAVWSESAGLEQASGTQFFAESDDSQAMAAYREGRLNLPAIGDQPRLIGLSGQSKGMAFELVAGGEGRSWKVGRDAASVDLAIPDDSVSGQHAQLVNEGARWKIVNWMSTNGTFVNGHKGLSTYLKHGDVIRMGSAELAFELPAGAPTSAAPAKTGRSGGSGFMAFLRRLFRRS